MTFKERNHVVLDDVLQNYMKLVIVSRNCLLGMMSIVFGKHHEIKDRTFISLYLGLSYSLDFGFKKKF